MIRKIFEVCAIAAALGIAAWGCDIGSDIQLPPALQQQQAAPPATPAPVPVPVAPVVPPQAAPVEAVAPAAPAAPPPTPLVPIEEEEDATAKKGGGDIVDKPLSGPKTEGKELIGHYSCKLETKGLPGGVMLPPFGCRIYEGNDGSLFLGPTGRSLASVRGSITDSTATGFFVAGKFTFPGNELKIKARMKLKGGGEYKGQGKGGLNDDKSSQVRYTLIMKKK